MGDPEASWYWCIVKDGWSVFIWSLFYEVFVTLCWYYFLVHTGKQKEKEKSPLFIKKRLFQCKNIELLLFPLFAFSGSPNLGLRFRKSYRNCCKWFRRGLKQSVNEGLTLIRRINMIFYVPADSRSCALEGLTIWFRHDLKREIISRKY